METAISASKFIYSILKNDNKLKEMVGDNIFPLIAEEKTTFPFIIFKKSNITTEYTKGTRVYDEVQFDLLVVSNKYDLGIEIAERVRELLELNNNEHLFETRILDMNEDYMYDSYVQEITFNTIVK